MQLRPPLRADASLLSTVSCHHPWATSTGEVSSHEKFTVHLQIDVRCRSRSESAAAVEVCFDSLEPVRQRGF